MAKAVATVEDFEKLANDVGLVPMTHLVPTITEMPGDVRGYAPLTALRMYNDGLAEPMNGKVSGRPAATAPVVDPEAERKGAIEIPDGVEDQHHLQRIALARKITGTDGEMKVADADAVIRAERERRAAGDAGPNAVTTAKTITV